MRVKELLEPGGRGPGDFRWRPVDGIEAREVGVEGPLATYTVDHGVEVLATFRGEPCAVAAPAGKGRVIACGFLPQYFTEESQRLFEEIFVRAPALSRVCRASEPAIVVQRGSERHQLLAVIDVLGHRRGMRLTASTGDGQWTFPVTGSLTLAPSESRLLWVDLDLGYACLRHCTSELVPQDPGRRRFLAHGAPGTPGEIALDRSVRVRADGVPVTAQRADGTWVFPYTHTMEPVVLEIEDV